MKGFLLAAAVLSAMTSAAVAEPKKMTDAEMGEVAAGVLDLPPVVVNTNVGLDLPDVDVATQVSQGVQLINAFAGVFPLSKGNASVTAAGQSDLGNDLSRASNSMSAQ